LCTGTRQLKGNTQKAPTQKIASERAFRFTATRRSGCRTDRSLSCYPATSLSLDTQHSALRSPTAFTMALLRFTLLAAGLVLTAAQECDVCHLHYYHKVRHSISGENALLRNILSQAMLKVHASQAHVSFLPLFPLNSRLLQEVSSKEVFGADVKQCREYQSESCCTPKIAKGYVIPFCFCGVRVHDFAYCGSGSGVLSERRRKTSGFLLCSVFVLSHPTSSHAKSAVCPLTSTPPPEPQST